MWSLFYWALEFPNIFSPLVHDALKKSYQDHWKLCCGSALIYSVSGLCTSNEDDVFESIIQINPGLYALQRKSDTKNLEQKKKTSNVI